MFFIESVKNEHLQAHHTEYTQKYGLCEHAVDLKVTGLANCADDGMRQIGLAFVFKWACSFMF